MKLTTAIIDDEIHAIETLKYDLEINHANEVEILFTTTNPIEGAKRVRTDLPDLLFLDVDMPGISGLDLIRLVDDLPLKIVFTTAHIEYAVKAVETVATGYLVKPVQADDLQRIILKVMEEKNTARPGCTVSGKIPVADSDGIELVPFAEIIYLKSDSNYCELKLTGNRKLVASKTLKHFEELLPADQFLRIHKSYLINIHQVKKYLKSDGGVLVMQNDDILPVSKNHRLEVHKLIAGHI